MTTYTYESLGKLISNRILDQQASLHAQYNETKTISRMVLDNLLA